MLWVEELAEGQDLFVWLDPKWKMKTKGLLLICLDYLHYSHPLYKPPQCLAQTFLFHSQHWTGCYFSAHLHNLLSLFLHEVAGWILFSQAKQSNLQPHTELCVSPEERPHCDNALSLSSWETWPRGHGQVSQAHLQAGRQAGKVLQENRPYGVTHSSPVHGLGSWKNQIRWSELASSKQSLRKVVVPVSACVGGGRRCQSPTSL